MPRARSKASAVGATYLAPMKALGVTAVPTGVWRCEINSETLGWLGTGAVINTSLNMHGKPMSDTADGVVEAWLESGVQHLALGSALLSKSDSNEHARA
jgi:hypothetical protein